MEEAREEFEQDEPRGLDRHDQRLEHQDDDVAGDEHDPAHDDAVGRVHQRDDRRRQARVRERERADARERQRVDQDLHEALDEVGQRGQCRRAAPLDHRVPDAEPQRAGAGDDEPGAIERGGEDADIRDCKAEIGGKPRDERAAPMRLDAGEQEPQDEEERAARERDQQDRQRIVERRDP